MRKFFFPLLVVLSMNSCSTEQQNQQVAEELHELYNKTLQNLDYPYHNSLKAEYLTSKLAGIPEHIPVQARYDAAYEYLKAGRNEDCIALVEPVIKAQKINQATLPYYRIIANAYLRLGEQKNCFHTKGINACTIPFVNETMHSKELGSTKAMEFFEILLEYNPNDLESRWLYNIAARTLGRENEIDNKLKIDLDQKSSSGIKFENIFTHSEMKHAGGASLEDFDNDGDLDIFTSSYHLNENTHFYRNENGKWKDKSKESDIKGITGGLNFIHGDVNNDGRSDILILRGGWLSVYGQFPPSLLINQSDGTFRDETEKWGVKLFQPSQTAVFSDLNLDGKLDLVLGAESTGGLNFRVKVFMNEGERFRDVTEESGIDYQGFVKGVVAGDINNDLYPEIFISVLGNDNLLYLNNGETAISFQEVSSRFNVQKPKSSFVCWFFDYDNDGYEDLYVGGYNIDNKRRLLTETIKDFLGDTIDFSHPKLYRNINGEYFEDVTNQVGLNKELFAMGGNFGDVNNDGYLDIYLGTGEFNMWAVMPNRLFINEEARRFKDETFSSGLGMIQKGHGIAFGDVDHDGDEDIFHTIGGAVEGDVFMNYLYENQSPLKNWISLDLIGAHSNKDAIGAKVSVHYTRNGSPKTIYRVISTGGSFGNNSLSLNVGLEQQEKIDSVVIQWPHINKNKCIFNAPKINTFYKVMEQNCELLILD